MEKSKVPVRSRLKSVENLDSSKQSKMLRLRTANCNCENKSKKTIGRGFSSCSDIRKLNKTPRSLKSKIGSEMNIHNLIKKSVMKTIPVKQSLPKLLPKANLKKSTFTNAEIRSVSKLSKSMKIPVYDYKTRYNMQLEKNTLLESKLKEKDMQLAEKNQKYDVLMNDYLRLQASYDICVKNLEEMQEECDIFKYEHEQTILKMTDFESSVVNLQREASSYEEQCHQLKDTNNMLLGERNLFKRNNENLKQENIDLSCKATLHWQIIKEQRKLLYSYKENVNKLEDLRRSMHNQIQDLKGTIRVFCRVRPQLPWEKDKLLCNFNYVDEDTIEIKRVKESVSTISGKLTESTLEFVFDKVFQPQSSQNEIFEELSQLIQSAMDGYNVCVFAYGQTGSGKTFTMQGEERKDCIGMIPRSVNLIFKLVHKYHLVGWTYTVSVSFLEIYNEMVRDLLSTNAKEHLEIRFNDGKGTTVKNLTTVTVDSANELHALMQRANQNRAVAVTNFNEHSSRSHAVTKITVVGTNNKSKIIYTGSLSLVDLAGSESAKTSERMVETKNINKSLSALGTVMMALQNKESHIPYRNSKLTYLLQSCLGGNSKTLMFINIAPMEECYSESVSALRFAAMVKEVKLLSKKNKTYIK